MLQRGKHLVAADRALATGGGFVARLFAGGFHKLIERIDSGSTRPFPTAPSARWADGGRGRLPPFI
jgi:hypothetical protein